MRGFIALVRTEVAVFSRDKTAVTLTFLFPIVFILVFGFLMGGSHATRLGVVIGSDPPDATISALLRQTKGLRVTEYPDKTALVHGIAAGKVDFGLCLGESELRFIYDSGRVQENYAFAQIAHGISARYNLIRQGVSPVVGTKEVTVGKVSGGWVNLVVPGVIAFSILSAGLSAVSGHLTMMKERRQLDRFLVTPMRPVALLAAIGVVRLLVVYISTLLTLFIAMGVLGLKFSIHWGYYTIFVAAAAIGTMGLGTVIALLVRRPASAGNLANIIAMIMMFFSGIYFPIEIMPSYLRVLSKALPLTYMADAMRYVTGVAEMQEARFWGITISLFGIGVILFPFLSRYVVRADRG